MQQAGQGMAVVPKRGGSSIKLFVAMWCESYGREEAGRSAVAGM